MMDGHTDVQAKVARATLPGVCSEELGNESMPWADQWVWEQAEAC